MNTIGEIREVWRSNLVEEMNLMMESLSYCPFIAIDTEFPGCLRTTAMNATETDRYNDMKYNVDKTKLIQLGFTLFDSNGGIGGTWEVNFSGFREKEDPKNDKSVAFLKRNGLDLEKIRFNGVSVDTFFHEFLQILNIQPNLSWVTFHGSYDIAYLVKFFTRSPLLHTIEGFADTVGRTLGRVYDMKAMASRLRGLNDRVGLEKLASEFGVSRIGNAHHAGSDSLLTARVFIQMATRYQNLSEFEGFIYGIGSRIVSRRMMVPPITVPPIMVPPMMVPPIMVPPFMVPPMMVPPFMVPPMMMNKIIYQM